MNEMWNDFKDGFLETFLFGVRKISIEGIGSVLGLVITIALILVMCVGFIIIGEMIFPSGG